MSGGFIGKYAVVDLDAKSTETIHLDEGFYKKFLSGYGLGAAVITQRQRAGLDPLSPESYLGFCSGLLTGSGMPFTGRFMVVGKSPLTGGWGDANCGGYLSREIKRAGYDAVFFTGRAEKPVWVHVSDEGIQIKDASTLWGKDTMETEDAIKSELDDKKVQIASIGIAGEKLSRISGVVTDGGRIAARSGLGALMGSKNLKAVSFRGSQDVPVARPDEVKTLTEQLISEYRREARLLDRISIRFLNFISKLIAVTGIRYPAEPSTVKEIFSKWGTSGLTVYSALIGDMPIKNWDGSGYVEFTFDMAEKISGENLLNYQKRKYSCQSCPLGCGGMVDIKEGRFKETQGHKPEYETIAAFGGLLMHNDLDAIIELNEMCNRAGIDTISTGGTVAFAIECFENGIIDKNTTDGLELGWGKTDEIIKLTEMLINREGFGDVLADGVKKAAEKIGQGSERFAVHAGGQELPMHDSRLDHGYAIAYQCEPTPGRHTIASYQDTDLRSGEKQFPEIDRMVKSTKKKEIKLINRHTATSYYAQIISACGMCLFGPDTIVIPMVEYLNAVTGWDLSPDEYIKTGKRILCLRKAFNVREGVKPQDSKLHPRALGDPPQTKGPIKGFSVDMGTLEKEFYQIVGWDPETGGPTSETMKELGIDYFFG